ncbi:hypothetical protein AAVH_22331, partial [Aphelenchoides avenae]
RCWGTHVFCAACTRRHAETTLSDHKRMAPSGDGLACMEPACGGTLKLESLAPVLGPWLISDLQKRLVIDKGVSCENSEKATGVGLLTVEERISAIIIRQCPQCSRRVTKEKSCQTATCPCGTEICFVCNDQRQFSVGLSGDRSIPTSRFKCKFKCSKITAFEERKKIKKVYNEASTSEQKFLKQLYPDIESFTSRQSLAIAAFEELSTEFWHLPIVIVVIFLVYFFMTSALLEGLIAVHVCSLISELRLNISKGDSTSTENADGPIADAALSVEERISAIVIRRCPHCSRGLMKEIGCAIATCPCGTEICFVCKKRRQFSCNVKCVKMAAVEDMRKIQDVYDEASAAEQSFLKELYPDIESFTSPQSLERDCKQIQCTMQGYGAAEALRYDAESNVEHLRVDERTQKYSRHWQVRCGLLDEYVPEATVYRYITVDTTTLD